MGVKPRGLPSWFGTAALLLVIVCLGAGGALLVGRAPVSAPPTGQSLMIWLPAQAWAVILIAPLIVGFVAYLVQASLSTPFRFAVRLGIVLVTLLVAGALLAGVLLQTNWVANTPISTGESNGPGSGHGSGGAGGSGTSNGTNNSTGGGGSNGGGGGGTGKNGTGGGGNGGNGTGKNGTGGGGSGGNGTGKNGTGGGRTGGNGTGSNNSSGGLFGTGDVGGGAVHVANWVFLLAAVGVSIGVVLAVFPGAVRRRNAPHLGGSGPRYPSAVAGSLTVPSAPLDPRAAVLASEAPREAIVRIYGGLLGRVGLSREALDPFTAEEIQRTRFAELHVSPAPAAALTQLFEEACYSDHPVEPKDVARFVETARVVEHDLFVGGGAR